ncbi:MAG TPA: hypothetical protein VFV90_06350, partial [Usitatibacter sp.]|nr:hypothetical protein [Usitatibacter sp.]
RGHDLAVRIYVELVARNTELADGKVKMAASAANVAILSLKLSEAFLEAEAEAIAAKAPVKDFKLGTEDIAKWGN